LTKLAGELAAACLTWWAAGMQIQPTAKNARNHSQCDSMLIGDTAGANTYPYIQARPLPPVSVFTFIFYVVFYSAGSVCREALAKCLLMCLCRLATLALL